MSASNKEFSFGQIAEQLDIIDDIIDNSELEVHEDDVVEVRDLLDQLRKVLNVEE